jgi:hypothetical protein
LIEACSKTPELAHLAIRRMRLAHVKTWLDLVATCSNMDVDGVLHATLHALTTAHGHCKKERFEQMLKMT